jgi:hypothetical protein
VTIVQVIRLRVQRPATKGAPRAKCAFILLAAA